jgi:serine/threonine-protein kinase
VGPAPLYQTPDDDVRELLQSRLSIVLLLGFCLWTTIMVVSYAGLDPLHPRDWSDTSAWPSISLLWCNLFIWVAGACLVLLRSWPLPWLRVFEASALVAHAACMTVASAVQYHFFVAYDVRGPDVTIALLNGATLHNGFGWLVVIVAWGLVVPHPWKRKLAIVLGLAACPLLLGVGLLLTEPAEWRPALTYSLVLTCQLLGAGLAMALFGSYRVSALEEEVAAARQEARAARKLGAYTLKQRLGAGGMGEVYLAEHRLLKRPCAVKLIHADRASDLQAQARFDREVQATASLKHPNTVEIYDYGRTDDGTFYYVMEHLDGLSLEELVSRHGPMSVARVVHVLRQLCGALHEAHERGVVHRDIKPSNILLCRHGGLFDVVKLVDFGLALSGATGPSNITRAGILMGTPDYVSPEQADGTGADARSDLYSLGAAAYFLLIGKPPYAGETVLDVLIAHRHQSVPDLSGAAPPELEAALRRCLAKAPEERFPSAAELERGLRKCAEAMPWTDADARAWWEKFGRADGGSPQPHPITAA